MAGRPRRGSTPRRKRIWMRDYGTDVLVGTTPFHRDLTTFWALAGGPDLIGATVVRVRLSLAVARTAGASVLPFVFVGVKVGDEAVEAVDQDPSAGDGAHLDWMLWSKSYLTEASGGQAVAALGSAAWTYDVKSMRKLEELNQTLWMVLGGTGSLTDSYAISWAASTLVLLP